MTDLTAEQRATIQDWFNRFPDAGYKSACRAAGILGLTKAEARTLVESDPDLAEAREKALGVDEDSAWKRIADMARDPEHKDAFRANTFILGAAHGRSETSRVEVSGREGGPLIVEDRSASLAEVLDVLRHAGAADSG